jgi:ABC-2 type transport system ATP-binding protein
MPDTVLSVNHLVRRYESFTAVDDLSFDVYRGEIFGLLGPNGAGKTTAIRTMMGIFEPDEGTVSILGRPPAQARKHTGYLPEERGLYRDLRILDVLVYLAELKGLSRADARHRSMAWLERVSLADRARDKVKDLSGGMQQKLQLAAAMVHDPDLLVLDEPFQALDPVNVDLVKTMIRELRSEGKTIILSAHQMNLVEALCDRIILINKGRAVLYGVLEEIKERYAARTIRLRAAQPPGDVPGVVRVEPGENQSYILYLDGGSPQDVLAALINRHVEIESFEVGTAPLEEIFIDAVKEQPHA